MPVAVIAVLVTAGSAQAGEPNCRSCPGEDTTPPEAPVITSADFPEDESWVDMVGEYGTFTFSSPSDDVVRYRYDFTTDDDAPIDVDAGPSGTTVVRFMPVRSGPHILYVTAFDCAVNSSARASYDFAVASARAAAGAWDLADPVGSGEAADADDDHPAVAGPGVIFGADGPKTGTAAEFDGTAGAHLTTAADSLVNTREGFAATAWVRLADLSEDRVAVSVDGNREAGFTLGYSAAEQVWSFEIPKYDADPFTRWRVASGPNTVEADEWAHLAGVYDAYTHEMRLYVNGELVGAGERGSSWTASGPVQIGQGRDNGQYGGHWHGRLAEVNVFDRVAFQDEIELMTRQPVERTGYWQVNEASAGQSPEYDGGQPLILHGATVYQQVDPLFDPAALSGSGHLELDGVDDYAATSSPVVDTSGSFTVAARVRLPVLLKVAGQRWPVEEDLKHGKQHAALTDSQVRTRTAWHRHQLLSIAALAIKAVAAAQARHHHTPPPQPHSPDQPPPSDLTPIPLTVPEISRLHALLNRAWQPIQHHLHWSLWRRLHQARARWYHRRARLAIDLPP